MTDSNCTQSSTLQHSGENGKQLPKCLYPPVSLSDYQLRAVPADAQTAIKKLPAEPVANQRVSLVSLGWTHFLVASDQAANVKDAPAALFDAFISLVYGEITNVDRAEWPLGLRWRAINEALALAQSDQRPVQYLRLDLVPEFGAVLRIMAAEPVE